MSQTTNTPIIFRVERINANGYKVYLTKEGAFAGDINEWSDDQILSFTSAAEAQAACAKAHVGKPRDWGCYVVDHTDYTAREQEAIARAQRASAVHVADLPGQRGTHGCQFMLILAMILLFTQFGAAADLPPAAQALVDKADADVAKIHVALAEKLSKLQDVATKKGDLDGAMAIKKKIETLVVNPFDVSFSGEYEYSFTNGHKGHLSIHNEEAQTDGYRGPVAKTASGWTITWSNGSQWQIYIKGTDVTADSSDGHSKLLGK